MKKKVFKILLIFFLIYILIEIIYTSLIKISLTNSNEEFLKMFGISNLDELPELWNVFVGEMSIVGPRPLSTAYLPYYNEYEKQRHDVRPGLTGYAQVNGRNVTVWDVRLKQDLDYIEKCSLPFDLKILWQTVAKTAKQEDILVGEQHGEGHGKLDKVRKYVPRRKYLFKAVREAYWLRCEC